MRVPKSGYELATRGILLAGCSSLAIFVGAHSVHSTGLMLDWDPIEGNGVVDGGSGDWFDAVLFTDMSWTADDGSSNTTFTDGDQVTFGVSAGTVTIPDLVPVSPSSITFDLLGYTISGGSIGTTVYSPSLVVNADATIASDFEGSGTVTKSGTGALNLSSSGLGGHTGTFSVTAGQVTVNGGMSSNFSVSSGATLVNNDMLGGTVNSSGTFTNNNDVQGTVTVGGGTTTNSSGATFSSAVNVNGGILNNEGSIDLGQLSVTGGTYNHLAGASNQGGLAVSGTGIANLIGSVDGGVSNSGTVNLTGNADSAASGFINNGSGTLATMGFEAQFHTLVNNGILDMNDATVNDRVRPVDTFGSSLSGSSIWNVNVDNANNSDMLFDFDSVGGTLNIFAIGGTGDYTNPEYTYTLVDNSTLAVTGTFSSVTTNMAFLTPVLDYAGGDGFDVILTLNNANAGIDLNPFADTGNQGNFAMTMDDFDYSGTDGQEVQNGFNGLTNGQVDNAINQTSGENLLSNNGFGAVGQFNNAVQNGSSDVGGFGDVLNYAHSGDTADKMDATFALVDGSDPLPEKEFDTRFWAKAFGGYGEVDGDSTAEGFANAFGGVAAGIEVLSRIHRAAVSIGGGYSHGWHDIDNSDSDITSDSFHGGLSASLGSEVDKGEGLGARFAASFSHHHYDSKRDITFGALNRTAEVDYSGHTLSANMNLRYGIAFGETETTTMTFAPIAGIQLLAGRNDDFSETGAGTLNLTVEADDYDSAQTKLGIELASRTYAGMTKIKTQIIAAWLHELGDTEMTSTNTIAGSPTSYVVSTPELPEDLFALTTRVAAHFANGIAFSLRGDAEWSEASESYAGEARISLPM